MLSASLGMEQFLNFVMSHLESSKKDHSLTILATCVKLFS